MDGGVSTAEDELRGSSDHFLTSLRAFWLHSVASCGSPDAAHLCVSAGLALLSAVLLLISSLLTACQKSKLRGEYSEQTIVVFYSFLGNLCSTVGAVLSRQLHLQISMAAFAALMDAVHCILCCLPLFLCWNSKTQRRLRAAKRRRRQHFLAVGVLMVVAGGFLKSRVDEPITIRSISGRKLLHSSLQISSWSPIMDSKEILGYILGLLASVIAWTSRFPALCRARRGQNLTPTFIVSGFLCSVSGALYAAAILLQDVRFGFLIRVVPWLLSSIGCVILDLLILVIHWCKMGTRQNTMKLPADVEGLLGMNTEHTAVMKQQKKQQKPPSAAQTKTKNAQKMTKMGQYMDVSGQQTSKLLSLNKEVTLSKDGLEVGPPHRMVHVVRVDGLCSSDTSYSSTSDSTDLEWDFEAAIAQWSKPAAEPQEGDKFPLQDWPTKPKPFSVCICSMTGLLQKSRCSANESSSAVS
ncbi:transmembrane protein 44 isoform X2 [Poecilia reticulata]|uniref:transmembrane protein 44 isoform X2 n=1 Tax=Poecilia reticulata TaxID=8081 RepID=UPI0004A3E37C|nr:PREDICTED: transmembrane protein 44 isoform X2 [Poecilia reticulata]